MYLLVDWGNSGLKYLLVGKLTDQAISSSQIKFVSSVEELSEQITQTCVPGQLSEALICSVKSEGHNSQLLAMLKGLPIACFVAAVSHGYCDIKLAYKNPEQMGVDRWVAMVASFEQNKSVGVIDLGTAITIDLLNEKGCHLGGHIIPGLKILKSSLSKIDKVRTEVRTETLESNTYGYQQNPLGDPLENSLSHFLGNSTQTCVDFGIDRLVASYLKQVTLDAQREFGIVKWHLTGGDSQKWFDYLCEVRSHREGKSHQILSDFILSPKLIFQGLSRLYRQRLDPIE